MSILDIFSDLNNHKDIHNCLCLFTNFVHNGTKIFGKECGKDCLKIITELKKFCIDNNGVIWFYIFNSDDEEYVKNIVQKLYDIYLNHSNNKKFISRGHNNIKLFKYTNNWDVDEIFLNIKKNMQIKYMPKFDYIIQNPPYSGSLHLDFFKEGLNLLSDTGKMTIIEPATWLINVRKNGKALYYDEIKRKVNSHIYKIIIENYDKEFNVSNYIPFSITYIDMDRNFEYIDFYCFGEYRKVYNIYDCNLIGSYNMIWSIFNKVNKFGDLMKNHIYKCGKTLIDKNTYFCKYPEIMSGTGGSLCGLETLQVGGKYEAEANWNTCIFGSYIISYHSAYYHYFNNDISNKILYKYDRGKHITDKPAECLYGTKEELENWKYFIFNNKLPLFISIVLIIDMHNNCKDMLCWLVDKKYTDEEIYQLIGITEDEQKFIDKTLKKYERNSPWFKRYICGPNSASDEEVQKFIKTL